MKWLIVIILLLPVLALAQDPLTLEDLRSATEVRPVVGEPTRIEYRWDAEREVYYQERVDTRRIKVSDLQKRLDRMQDEHKTLLSLQKKQLTEDEAWAVLRLMGATVLSPQGISGTFTTLLDMRIAVLGGQIEAICEALDQTTTEPRE